MAHAERTAHSANSPECQQPERRAIGSFLIKHLSIIDSFTIAISVQRNMRSTRRKDNCFRLASGRGPVLCLNLFANACPR